MMDSLIQSLPEAIRKHMEGREYTIDDMGNCGIADKWEDIAMLYRSLRHNFDGTYGKVYPGLDPDSFFEELGIEPDREKIDYYILLDELF